jgi:hypothetical protein
MRREDFTKALLACVQTKTGGHRVLTIWEPDSVAAPERHFLNGAATDLSKEEQFNLLSEQNNAFDIVDSLLNLQLHKSVYGSYSATVESEKEQVWLFAFYWLRRYYNELMEPDIMHSPFYRQDHSRFIELLTKMCAFRPEKRITFLDAARLWCPGMLSSPEPSPEQSDEDESVEDTQPNVCVVSNNAALPRHDAPSGDATSCSDELQKDDSSMNPPQPLSVDVLPSVRRRLVLKGLHGPQGRSRTRKSSRS